MRLCHRLLRWQPATTYVAGRRSATYGLGARIYGRHRDATKSTMVRGAAGLDPGGSLHCPLNLFSFEVFPARGQAACTIIAPRRLTFTDDPYLPVHRLAASLPPRMRYS
jgi:hypothetical protein